MVATMLLNYSCFFSLCWLIEVVVVFVVVDLGRRRRSYN